jgi:dihydrofolate reductase
VCRLAPELRDDEDGCVVLRRRGDRWLRYARCAGRALESSGGWEPTTILRGLDDVRALKARPGADIVVTGSLTLVRELVPSGLVDEYRLFVYPVVVGAGRRLFEPGTALGTLETVEARRFASGLVLLRYRVG